MFKVGVDVVRELYGVMAAKGAACGFVVTSGTRDATVWAKAKHLMAERGGGLSHSTSCWHG